MTLPESIMELIFLKMRAAEGVNVNSVHDEKDDSCLLQVRNEFMS